MRPWECPQTDRHTHTHTRTHGQTQNDFIICPMLYAIAMGQITIINKFVIITKHIASRKSITKMSLGCSSSSHCLLEDLRLLPTMTTAALLAFSPPFIYLSVIRTIPQNRCSQLASSNLTYKCSTMSHRNPLNLEGKNQWSTVPVWVVTLLWELSTSSLLGEKTEILQFANKNNDRAWRIAQWCIKVISILVVI